jgi:PAS domain S-box-containing protein
MGCDRHSAVKAECLPQMSPIKPALFTRLQKAIQQNRQSDAVFLLSQLFSVSGQSDSARNAVFLREIRRLGDEQYARNDLEASRKHYRLSLDLYASFFPDQHEEAIASSRRLCQLLQQQGLEAELSRAMDEGLKIVKRLQKAVSLPPVSHKQEIPAVTTYSATGTWDASADPLRAINVLIVEDSKEDAIILEETLSKACASPLALAWAENLSSAFIKLSEENIDVVLLDLSLPDSDSSQTLKRVKNHSPAIPIVVVSGSDDKEIALRSLQEGARDFLVKGQVDPSILAASIRGAFEGVRAEREQALRRQTSLDAFRQMGECAPDAWLYLTPDLTIQEHNRVAPAIFGFWDQAIVGKDIRQLVPKLNSEQLYESIAKRQTLRINTSHKSLELVGHPPLEIAFWPILYNDSVLAIMVEARVLSGSTTALPAGKQPPAEKSPDARRYQQQLLSDLSRKVLNGVSSKLLLIEAAHQLPQALFCEYSTVFEKRDSETWLLTAGSNWDVSRLNKALDHNIHPFVETVLAQKDVVQVSDFRKEPVLTYPVLFQEQEIVSGMFCRLVNLDVPFAIIGVQTQTLHVFSAEDSHFLQSLANIISTASHKEELADLLGKTSEELKRTTDHLQQFAYAASHDLQEPLRTIISYLELLKTRLGDGLDEKSNKFLNTTDNAARRMQDLISGMLEYSRISTRAQPPRPVNCNDLVDDLIGELEPLIVAHEAVVTRGMLPTVNADEPQLRRVFRNLITNAIKFKGTDPPKIKVSATTKSGEWVFSVNDNGIGIDMEYADRIFVIFQRLHTRRQYDGIGIGLAVAKKIIERHGGRMWVDSSPDIGSTFYFSIPV